MTGFGPVTPDRQKVMHMSPPCICTGVLKNGPMSRVGIRPSWALDMAFALFKSLRCLYGSEDGVTQKFAPLGLSRACV